MSSAVGHDQAVASKSLVTRVQRTPAKDDINTVGELLSLPGERGTGHVRNRMFGVWAITAQDVLRLVSGGESSRSQHTFFTMSFGSCRSPC